MRETRIYQPGTYQTGQSLELSADGSHHVAVVLRLQPGDKLIVFCGDNQEFESVITAVHKKKVTVTLLSARTVNRESSCRIHLAQAISKGERMEFVIQKAVELGVASIKPLITARSVVKLDAERMKKKISQWQSIAIAACEQSGRNQLVLIEPIMLLKNYLPQIKAPIKFVLDPRSPQTWRDYAFDHTDIALLIGPEGGFSLEEIHEITSHEFHPLCLGPRILRTETAAIAALSILQAMGGDL